MLKSHISAADLHAVHGALVKALQSATLRRVAGGKGWVVHGLAIEFGDGTRRGTFLSNEGEPIDLNNDSGSLERGADILELQPGESIRAVRGRHSTMGYLCGEVALLLSSGRQISFVGDNASVFGGAFEFAAPPNEDIVDVRFGSGRCQGITLRSETVGYSITALVGMSL